MKFVISAEYTRNARPAFRKTCRNGIQQQTPGRCAGCRDLHSPGIAPCKRYRFHGDLPHSIKRAVSMRSRVVEFVEQTLHTSEQLGHSLYFDNDQAEDLEEPPMQAFCMKCRMMREIRLPGRSSCPTKVTRSRACARSVPRGCSKSARDTTGRSKEGH